MRPLPETSSPAARWTVGAAIGAAVTVVLADAFQLASHVIEPTTRDTVDRFAWIAGNPDAAAAAKSFDLLALPFLFGTTLVYVLLSRHRSPRLAYAGGVLFATGFVGLSAVEGYETLMLALVEDGRFETAALVDAVENGMSSGPGLVMMLLFLLPALAGLLLLAVALWRARSVPRAAVLLIPGALIADVFLNEGLGAVPHWVPHAIGLVGGSWIAVVVLLACSSSGRPVEVLHEATCSRAAGWTRTAAGTASNPRVASSNPAGRIT